VSPLHAGSFVFNNLPELVPRPQVCQPHLWQSGRIKKQKGGRTRFLAFFTAAETHPRRTNTRGLQGSFIASAKPPTHDGSCGFLLRRKRKSAEKKAVNSLVNQKKQKRNFNSFHRRLPPQSSQSCYAPMLGSSGASYSTN